MNGEEMYRWASDLFPICRSITGPGVRATLEYVKTVLPNLSVCSVPSGTKAFDWTIPDEWFLHSGELWDDKGNQLIEAGNNNLHVMGYSAAVDGLFSLDDLQGHIHSLPDQPDAIPYVTSYYKRDWGICLAHNDRLKLEAGSYQVKIDADIIPGVMNYGELVIPGKTNKEVLLSTNICHPSMANNELSGPVVLMALARELAMRNNRLTYRILFLPETIGAIYYISKHLDHLRDNMVEGFHVICVGDGRPLGWGERGSDDRQWNSALVNLPVSTITRGKIGDYPEYHTSLDDMDYISAGNLSEAYRYVMAAINGLEMNKTYRAVYHCEPMLGKRGLYPNVSTKDTLKQVEVMLHILRLADGHLDMAAIAHKLGVSLSVCADVANRLEAAGVLEEVV